MHREKCVVGGMQNLPCNHLVLKKCSVIWTHRLLPSAAVFSWKSCSCSWIAQQDLHSQHWEGHIPYLFRMTVASWFAHWAVLIWQVIKQKFNKNIKMLSYLLIFIQWSG